MQICSTPSRLSTLQDHDGRSLERQPSLPATFCRTLVKVNVICENHLRGCNKSSSMQATSTVLQLPAEFVCGKLQLQHSTCQVWESRDADKSHHTGGCCRFAYQHAHLVAVQSGKREGKKHISSFHLWGRDALCNVGFYFLLEAQKTHQG